MAVLTIITNPSAISRIEATKVTPLTMDLTMNVPYKFVTKQDIERRVKEFTKTPREKAALSTAKAGHKAPKGKLNSKSNQADLNKQLLSYYNSKLGFNLTKFNGTSLFA